MINYFRQRREAAAKKRAKLINIQLINQFNHLSSFQKCQIPRTKGVKFDTCKMSSIISHWRFNIIDINGFPAPQPGGSG